ncbi:MAG: serine/threonine protein kinase [Deltaproteobacteria bacterium]|nr:serine/threonine protein kinase [Deltaproteobacteria bacterium]
MLEALVRDHAQARVGKLLRGKWLLEELVGIGGMASVYRARHRNGARVAIKILHGSIADSEEVRARFVGEGYAANRIEHPAVVRVLDDDADEHGAPFLVMDFVDGRTLADAVQEHRFVDDELLDVAEQLCGALSAAHAAGVVHRDLKPDNLIVDPTGRIRVLDFGIARLMEDDEQSFFGTKTGVAFGTPGFISPEQALGRRHDIGPRSDLFALGATLFYLATGEFLHASQTPQELLIYVATKPARLLRDVAPHVSPDVAAIVDRATRMEMEERWPSADAMLEEVRAVRAARRGAIVRRSSFAPFAVLPPPPVAPIVAQTPEGASPRVSFPRVSLPLVAPEDDLEVATRASIARRALRRRRHALAAASALTFLGILLAFATSAKTPDAAAATRLDVDAGVAVTGLPSLFVPPEGSPKAEPPPSVRELSSCMISTPVPRVAPTKPSSPPPATARPRQPVLKVQAVSYRPKETEAEQILQALRLVAAKDLQH